MNYAVEGRRKLRGSITVNTSKNAAVALICGSLLNRGTTVLRRMPKIEEVHRLVEVLKSIGVKVRWDANNLIISPPSELRLDHINKKAASRTRSIAMLIGPLSHWEKNFTVPVAGGCVLGNRSLTAHIDALHTLGIEMKGTREGWDVRSKKKMPAEIVMYEASDTGVENALMAAALIPGITTIRFASANYMVQDLCVFLESMGVRIDGIGTANLVVHGIDHIDMDAAGEPSEDPIEAMFFIALAATTRSEIMVRRAPIDFIGLELMRLRKMGLRFTMTEPTMGNNGRVRLVDIQIMPSVLTASDEKIAPMPYPGINIDNLPLFVPIATQAEGKTLIHDWVYENRALYYTEMNKLGADVTLYDPHRVSVRGPTVLKAAHIESPPALRPASMLLIGMLSAKGESHLRNTYLINRGYENLHERLKKLGARIKAYE
ncbi:UDP-N-acetylglucosamine 1-carboxyvinyltransferase [Candidatus Kaiserbacteria bacterium]|nr:UDP-N-acetylglucosamine 1-carboxyvinyltransferase [Candidatus Kaiserbacteria bacterium]